MGIAPAGKSNECSPLCAGVDHLCNEVQLRSSLCSCVSLYLSGCEPAGRCPIVTSAVCPHPGRRSSLCSCSCGRLHPRGAAQTKMFAERWSCFGDGYVTKPGSLVRAALCGQRGPAPMPGRAKHVALVYRPGDTKRGSGLTGWAGTSSGALEQRTCKTGSAIACSC